MGAAQQVLLGLSAGTAFTPASLNARLWLEGNACSGTTTITAAPNSGIDGGTGVISGAPVFGTPLNTLKTMRFDSSAKKIDFTLGNFAAGPWSMFCFGARIAGTTVGAVLSNNWPNVGGVSKVFYAYTGGGFVVFGAGCCTVGTNNPSYSTASEITGTSKHGFYHQIGLTNACTIDNVTVTLGTSGTANVPSFTAPVMTVGQGDTSGSEFANMDIAVIMLFDKVLTGTEQTNLYNYYLSRS